MKKSGKTLNDLFGFVDEEVFILGIKLLHAAVYHGDMTRGLTRRRDPISAARYRDAQKNVRRVCRATAYELRELDRRRWPKPKTRAKAEKTEQAE